MWNTGKTIMVIGILAVAYGCATKPVVRTQNVHVSSIDKAFNIAMQAARDTNWIVRTTDKENGYLLAEREVNVLGRSGRADAYKLEVDFKKSANETIELSAKVTPPPGIIGGENPDSMVTQFLNAFEARSK